MLLCVPCTPITFTVLLCSLTGFPLIARWLVEYYGDTETVRPLW